MVVDTTIPLSLYIHVPWCIKKCPYCDFNSHTLRQALPEKEYIQALIKQLEELRASVQGRAIQSIFIGGGTPSLFAAQSYAELLQYISKNFQLSPTIEITLEANPGSVEQNKFQAYREIGINRLSLGVQSFQDSHLKKLGRIHSSDEAKRAITCVQQAGFTNFNIDIMFGLSQQTEKQALDDLQTALSFAPPHLSWYQLTLEPNTLFYKHPPSLPSDDYIVDMEHHGQALLSKHGLKRYEISAYTRNQPCQHNINYWQFGDYMGVGAGAHGKLTDLATGQIMRTSCYRNPKHYMATNKGFYQVKQSVPAGDIGFEYMLNALRLINGTQVNNFETTTRQSIHSLSKPIQRAIAAGLLEKSTKIIKPTAKGLQFLNDLTLYFLKVATMHEYSSPLHH